MATIFHVKYEKYQAKNTFLVIQKELFYASKNLVQVLKAFKTEIRGWTTLE